MEAPTHQKDFDGIGSLAYNIKLVGRGVGWDLWGSTPYKNGDAFNGTWLVPLDWLGCLASL